MDFNTNLNTNFSLGYTGIVNSILPINNNQTNGKNNIVIGNAQYHIQGENNIIIGNNNNIVGNNNLIIGHNISHKGDNFHYIQHLVIYKCRKYLLRVFPLDLVEIILKL